MPDLIRSRSPASCIAHPLDDLRTLLADRRAGRPAAARHDVAHGVRDVFLDLAWMRRMRSVALPEPTDDGGPWTGSLGSALAACGVSVQVMHPERGDGLRRLLDGVDVVIVPALAVDTLGHRLAAADDVYARLLQDLPPRTPALAVVHDDEILDAALSPLPSGPGDAALLGALTPTRLLPFGSGRRHAHLARPF